MKRTQWNLLWEARAKTGKTDAKVLCYIIYRWEKCRYPPMPAHIWDELEEAHINEEDRAVEEGIPHLYGK